MTTLILTADQTPTNYKNLNDAIDRGATVCLMGSFIKEAMEKRYNKFGTLKEKIIRFESAAEILQAMDGGYILDGSSTQFDSVGLSRGVVDDSDIDSEWHKKPDGYCDVAILTAIEFELGQNGYWE